MRAPFPFNGRCVRPIAALILGVVLLLGARNGVALQDQSAPRLLSRTPQPAYPPAATRAGAEGAVEFQASINADGTVGPIDIISVPSPGVGFEEAVRDAVRQWRFAAAM